MNRTISTLIFMVILAINVAIFSPQIMRSIVKINKMNLHLKDINVKILVYKEKIEDYNEKIEKLKNPYYREQIGREKLHMVNDGEIIYKLVD